MLIIPALIVLHRLLIVVHAFVIPDVIDCQRFEKNPGSAFQKVFTPFEIVFQVFVKKVTILFHARVMFDVICCQAVWKMDVSVSVNPLQNCVIPSHICFSAL